MTHPTVRGPFLCWLGYHKWKTIKVITFAEYIGYWLLKCKRCGRHGSQIADKAAASCIRTEPHRGVEYRKWMEGFEK